MSVDLLLRGRPVSSVFELLGKKENDITFSVGWALGKCPHLLQALLKTVFPAAGDLHIDSIDLQRFGDDAGFTDIELKGKDLHVIVEAKRGWCLPTAKQWQRYYPRFNGTDCKYKAFVAMSECSFRPERDEGRRDSRG